MIKNRDLSLFPDALQKGLGRAFDRIRQNSNSEELHGNARLFFRHSRFS